MVYVSLSLKICRAFLQFLDPDKFKSKEDFVRKYKNLSMFNEMEVQFFSLGSHRFVFNLDGKICVFYFIAC